MTSGHFKFKTKQISKTKKSTMENSIQSMIRRLQKVKAASVSINLYKLNIGVLFLGSLIPLLSNFFNHKMSCDYHGDFNSDSMVDYCFLYGTSYLSEDFKPKNLCGIFQRCHNHFATTLFHTFFFKNHFFPFSVIFELLR